MNVSLTPELERFTRRLVKAGRYRSASEVVRSGLRLLEEREAQTAQLRGVLEERLEQAANGEAVPFDADRLRAGVLARAAELRASETA